MGMRKRWYQVAALFVLGTVLFSVIQFGVLPQRAARQQAVAAAQNDALTHDISAALPYQNLYLGDVSNTVNLFYHLPLYQTKTQFEIDSEHLGLTVYYFATVDEIGTATLRRDLVYNAAAAMALIDNLQTIRFELTGAEFVFTREDLQAALGGQPLGELLQGDTWRQTVQQPLAEDAFVDTFYSADTPK